VTVGLFSGKVASRFATGVPDIVAVQGRDVKRDESDLSWVTGGCVFSLGLKVRSWRSGRREE
jgi:hypothetical protein